MRIVVGSDKVGMKIKDAVVEMLISQGHTVEDVGTKSVDNAIPHTLVGAAVARKIQNGEADRGLLFCGTGMGVALAANKFKGVYCGVVESVFAAKYCKQINNCNCMSLGGYIMGEYMAKEVVQAFIDTEFHPEFEQWRVDLLEGQYKVLKEIEDENFK